MDITHASFRENLKCSICLDILRSPKALACLHTFCEGCIQANIDAASANNRPRSIVCPVCRQQTKPPKNCAPTDWAKQLPTNWPLKSFIDKFADLAATTTVRATDDEVGGRMSIRQNQLEECKKIEMCPSHPGHFLKFYCNNHSAILCKECRAVVHRWGCLVEGIDSVVHEAAVTEKANSAQSQLGEIQQKLNMTMNAMKNEIKTVGNTVENFQSRLLMLRNEVDMLMTEMQSELAGTEFRDLTKSRLTRSQKSTITECDSLQEAMRISKSEMDVIERHGTPIQRFIAIERMHGLIPLFKKAADDNANHSTRVEIRHEGIEILESIVRMQQEMKSIQSVGVKLHNDVTD